MKLWKATAAMVMALGFAFSAAACGDDGAISGVSGLNSSSVKPESSSTSVSVSVGETSDKQSETTSEAVSEETSETTSEATSSEATSSEATSSEATSSETTSSEATSSETTSSDAESDSSEVVVNPLAEKFMGLIEKSVSEAKSFKLGYTFKSDYKENVLVPSYEDEYVAGKMNVTVSIKDTTTDIMAEVLQLTADNQEIKQAQVYMVNGYMYASVRMYVGQEQGVDKYEMSPYFKVKEDLAGTIEELKSMLNKQVVVPPEIISIAEEVLTKIEGQDFLPVWEDLKAATLNSFTVEGNTMVLGFDAPAYIADGLDAILEYDYKQTVETVVNAALLEASGDAELTMSVMLDQMATWGAVTVEDLYLNLDAWLTETYDVDVQTIYNTVVFDETFEKVAALLTGNPDQAEMLQSVTDLHEAMFGAEGVYAGMTVDHVLAMLEPMLGGMGDTNVPEGASTQSTTSASDEAEPITMAALAEMLRSMSTMPLNELPPVQQVVGMAQMIKEKLDVNELGMELGAEFEGAGDALTLKDLYCEVGFDFNAEITSYDENDSSYTYTSKTAFYMGYTLTDFSKTAVAITLPENMETVEVWFCENGCGEFVMEPDYNMHEGKILCDVCYAMANAEDLGAFNYASSLYSFGNGVYANYPPYAAKFEVTAEGKYRAIATLDTTEYKELHIYIVDANGQRMTYTASGSLTEHMTGVESFVPGVYYVIVENQSSEDVTINVEVERIYQCAANNCYRVASASNTVAGEKYCDEHYAAQNATMINGGEYETYGGKCSAYEFQVSSDYAAGDYSICFYSDSVSGYPHSWVEVFADVDLTQRIPTRGDEQFTDGLWVQLVYMNVGKGTYYVLFHTEETITYTVEYSRGIRQVECTNCWNLDVDVKQVAMEEFLCANCEAQWLAGKCYYADELLLNERVNLPDYGTKAIIDLEFTSDGEWYRVYKVVVPEDDYSGHYYVCAEDAVVSIVLYDENGNKVNMTDNGYDYRTGITSIQGYLSAGTYYVKVGSDMNGDDSFTIAYLYFARNNG